MGIISLFKNCYQYRDLLVQLIRREITARYKQSYLGSAWAIMQPLILMIIFTMIRSFIKIPSDEIPYPIFVYAALLPWTLFSNAVIFGVPSIISNANIIRKIYFPREIFVVSAVLVTFFDFLMGTIVYIILMIVYGYFPSYHAIIIPVYLLVIFMMALGFSLLFSSIGVWTRDIVRGIPILMQFSMFLCPVIYPLSSVPDQYRAIYQLNPLVGLIEGFRSVLLKNNWTDFSLLLYSIIGSIIIFELGYYFFKKLEMQFADVV